MTVIMIPGSSKFLKDIPLAEPWLGELENILLVYGSFSESDKETAVLILNSTMVNLLQQL